MQKSENDIAEVRNFTQSTAEFVVVDVASSEEEAIFEAVSEYSKMCDDVYLALVGLYYAILGLFIILFTIFCYYVSIMYILLACRSEGYVEMHRFVFSRHFLILLLRPHLVFTDFVYVLRGNFIAQSDDLPFETVETPLPILTFREVLYHRMLLYKNHLRTSVPLYWMHIKFVSKYILYEVCHLTLHNFVKIILNPFGIFALVLLNILYFTSHSIFSFCSFIILSCIVFYYYRSIQTLQTIAKTLTKHQSVEVFGLPQPFVKFIFNMYFFYSNVKGSKDSAVWLRNCAQFLMSYHDVLQVNFVLSSIFQLNIEAQSGSEYLDKAEELLDNWNSLRHSDLVAKTNRVFRALVFAGCVGATGQNFSSLVWMKC
jgi:hypothetical protein